MIDILKKWIGEFLIKIGKELVRSSRHSEFVMVSKSAPRNRYDW